VRNIDCAELVELAPELAAGNLCGEERAAAIAHLATCTSCQQLVDSLTAVTDRLLLIAPSAEPAPGFEERVLAAISSERRDLRALPLRRRRRFVPALAAAAVALAVIAAAILFGLRDAEPAIASAEMRTAQGQVVGEVFLHDDQPASVFMSLPGWAEQIQRYGVSDAGYTVHIETDDGDVTQRPVTLDDDASWATTLDIDADTVTSVSVVDGNGVVWCHATFD
jgi:hypothetical protein